MNPLGNCPGCGGDEPFEQIHTSGCPDTDGPDTDGGECPEWMCTVCGAGVIMGTVPSARAESFRADEADSARQHPRAA